MSGRFSFRFAQQAPPPLVPAAVVAPPPLPISPLPISLQPPPPMPAPAVPTVPESADCIDPPVPMPLTTPVEEIVFAPAMFAEPGEADIAEALLPPPPEPLTAPPATAKLAPDAPEPSSLLVSDKFMEAKVRLHRKLVEEVNLQALEKMAPEEAKKQIHGLVQQYVVAERLALNSAELAAFVGEIIDEMTGLGPLEPLLKDDTIADILINGPDVVYVERRGKMERTNTRFKDDAHLMRIVNKIVSAVGRRVDESQPLCDARLLDGSRVNVAVKPIAVDGALVSIRKFSKSKLSLSKLVEVGAMRQQMYELLSNATRCKTTIIISGGTGSGKTTMLNALSAFIPEDERLITIEDAAELQLQQPHVARMETRPPNLEGKGEIRQRDLIKNALRMRPDRVILGECRGEEAFDMLQAMNTGHEGSMATIHANNPREAVSRLEQMIGMAGLPMSQTSIRGQIAAAIRLIVQLQRMSDGKRRVTSIAEITGMEGDILQMQEIFKFVRVKTDADGAIHGHYEATGVRPRFLTDLQAKGVNIPGSYFEPGKPL
jgi:pilus assembly protein CpaF